MSTAAPDDTPRRRGPSHTFSARSALLTVLGKFGQPRHEPIWTATLVGAMALMGIEEKSARQALTRVASDGFLVGERQGRRTRWTITETGTAYLDANGDRIYGFLRDSRLWDGTWLVLAVTVPETQRQLRHHLRTGLLGAGLGSPAPGLWVTTDRTAVTAAEQVVDDLGIRDKTMSWIGTSAPLGDPRVLAATAWDLDALAATYRAFSAEFGRCDPTDPRDAFPDQVRLLHEWRRLVLADPAIPLELLPGDWPGPDALAVFRRCHEVWNRRATAVWDELRSAAQISESPS